MVVLVALVGIALILFVQREDNSAADDLTGGTTYVKDDDGHEVRRSMRCDTLVRIWLRLHLQSWQAASKAALLWRRTEALLCPCTCICLALDDVASCWQRVHKCTRHAWHRCQRHKLYDACAGSAKAWHGSRPSRTMHQSRLGMAVQLRGKRP